MSFIVYNKVIESNNGIFSKGLYEAVSREAAKQRASAHSEREQDEYKEVLLYSVLLQPH